jgi:phosphoglycerate kinase
MTRKLSLKDLDVKGKKVLMRVDFNVPLDQQGQITDDTRIRASLPSIKYALDQGGALILMSHLGRPKEKRVPALSLAPVAKRLSELIDKKVIMAQDSVGPDVEILAKNLKLGQILLLENLRFHPGEEHPDDHPEFVDSLAKLGDVYVNDAFGTAHRAHASTATIAKYFPNKAAAGFLLEKEIEFLSSLLSDPKRPFYAILGGAKISSKFGVIQALLKKVDALLIGGGMCYTFFKAQGMKIGNSIHEDEFLDPANNILSECQKKDVPLLLPTDIVAANKIAPDAKTVIVDIENGIPDGYEGVDIGPKTIKAFSDRLKDAGTVFWNGPLGVSEIPLFAKGTKAIAEVLAKLSAVTIVGGGDSIAALQSLGVADKMTHLSTGGGASLEFIEFGTLPGIEALSNRI